MLRRRIFSGDDYVIIRAGTANHDFKFRPSDQ
jgi:hypothetical protein